LRSQSEVPCSVLVDDRTHPLEMDFLTKALLTGRLTATEKLNQLARESFVIRAVALCGLAVRFHFASEIAEGGPSLRAMLAVFVPIIRPQGKKNADRYEDNLKEQVGKRASSAVKTHARKLKY